MNKLYDDILFGGDIWKLHAVSDLNIGWRDGFTSGFSNPSQQSQSALVCICLYTLNLTWYIVPSGAPMRAEFLPAYPLNIHTRVSASPFEMLIS